jgi:hypothetical protein
VNAARLNGCDGHFPDHDRYLVIDRVTELQLDAVAWPVFRSRRFDEAAIPGPTGRVRDWALALVRGQSTDTLSLLKDLSAGSTAKIATRAPSAIQSLGWRLSDAPSSRL